MRGCQFEVRHKVAFVEGLWVVERLPVEGVEIAVSWPPLSDVSSQVPLFAQGSVHVRVLVHLVPFMLFLAVVPVAVAVF